eukprot:TRINITY_DN7102_c0_g2_i1.p1 TRINITY_DN7102_c0_g2~~TRINITY_DN7102_c0_g2_i1.p1  ORF type:complete len:509 (+),score=64.89 TRINITY_DN7102_c0_g2_i1:47-1573(+)
MSSAVDQDCFEAYYLCRLAELTGRSTPKKHQSRTSTSHGSRRSSASTKPGSAVVKHAVHRSPSPSRKNSESPSQSPVSIQKTGSPSSAVLSKSQSDPIMQWKESSADYWEKKGEGGGGGGAISSKMKGKLILAFNRPTVCEQTEDDASYQQARVLQILQGARFFTDLDPAVQEGLSEHAFFVKEPKGHILFRQGDPPKNCYVVVSGSISFWMRQGGLGGASPREPPSNGMDGVKVPPHDFARVRSGEMFSTFSLTSDLGHYVRTAKYGEVFGELAFLNDNHRQATARCADDCELLSIPAAAFPLVKQMVKEQEQQKQMLLTVCIPGMASIPEPGPKDPPHPASVFLRHTYQEGHTFIRQGFIHISEFYVIAAGEVKVTRSSPANTGKCYHEVLQPGTVFGPLLKSAKEPFTFQVASKFCQIFKVRGRDFWQLPSSVLDGVMHLLNIETAKRLRRFCIVMPKGWETQQHFIENYRPRTAVASRLMKMSSRELKTCAMDARFWDKLQVNL